ncbi:hypothetical protein B296_00021706 [Ensete ventricosum]|uniref:Uncharacterized protein n=1 Tax=Ensete ventricosum TaxID=4639 RepID=A0A426ZA48_ENSVE|nr:hypothetical protein B296_00021706 [Ensete ventricosum]
MVAYAFSRATLSSTARSFSAFFCITRATERNSSTSQFFALGTSMSTFNPWSSFSGAFAFSRSSASPRWTSSNFTIASLAQASTLLPLPEAGFGFRAGVGKPPNFFNLFKGGPTLTDMGLSTIGSVAGRDISR